MSHANIGAGADPAPIPDSAAEDIPPDSKGNPESKTRVMDPKEKHRIELEKAKLKFAFIFTGACVGGFVVLSVMQYFTPGYATRAVGTISTVSDALKLLATTSLGYIFGRTTTGNGDS